MIVLCEASSKFHRKRGSKMIVSCEASSKFHKRRFQNERFMRSFLQMIVSCEASSKFHRKSFQNERFVRSFRQFSQKKVPKWSFRARLHRNFTKEGSKTSVSREAASKFHRKSFQNERFVRSFRQFSQKKVPKWSFRARLHRNFTKEGSKTSVSREASPKFYKGSFQNDRFVRGFLEISQNKLPKRAFCAMLPTIFTEKTSEKDRSARCFRQFYRKNFQKDRKLKMEKNSPKKWKKIPRKVLDPIIYTCIDIRGTIYVYIYIYIHILYMYPLHIHIYMYM